MTKWKKRLLMWVFNLCNYVLLYLYYVVVGYWHWNLKWWVVIWKRINCHDCYYISGGHFKINPNNSLRHCVPPPSYGILVTQFHFSPFCFTSLYFSLAFSLFLPSISGRRGRQLLICLLTNLPLPPPSTHEKSFLGPQCGRCLASLSAVIITYCDY